jgi:hypothetical protein
VWGGTGEVDKRTRIWKSPQNTYKQNECGKQSTHLHLGSHAVLSFPDEMVPPLTASSQYL